MDDQCPVAFAVGSTGTTGSGTILTTTYITGCNPAGKDIMKNPNALPTPAPRSHHAGRRATLALPLLALPAVAQVRHTEDDDSASKPPPTETVRKLVYENLWTTFPAFNKTVLTTYEPPNAREDNLAERFPTYAFFQLRRHVAGLPVE